VSRAAVAVAAGLVLAAPAAAKTTREVPYRYQPVWATMVRFLRVDENLKVTEKDEETGYVLFQLTEGKRTFNGAAELFKVEGGTRIILRIADRPSYMEAGLLDRFADKLHEELGDPPQAGEGDAPPPDAGPPEQKPEEKAAETPEGKKPR